MVRLFLSLTLIFVVTTSIRTSNGFTAHNSLLTGYVFKTFLSIDWLHCLQECHKQDICLSYNFFPSRKICELNNFGSKNRCKADTYLIESSGWIHHVLDTSQLQELKAGRANAVSAKPKENITATFTCDNAMEIFADARSLGKGSGNWKVANTFLIPEETRVISVAGKDWGSYCGILGSFSNGLVTNESWKCTNVLYPRWNSPDFDAQNWPAAVVVGKHGVSPWGVITGIANTAEWIWTADRNDDDVYCRLDLQ